MEINQYNGNPTLRRSTEQKMFELIEEQQQSNMSISSFCDRHQIIRSRYYYWLRKYRGRQSGENVNAGFALLKLESDRHSPLFCELVTRDGGCLRFFQPVGVSFLRALL